MLLRSGCAALLWLATIAAAQSPDAFDVWHSALSHMFDDSALTSAGAELFLTPRWTLLANSTASSLTVRRPTPAPARCGTRGKQTAWAW